MVQLLIGHKGSGKTNKMIQLANEDIKTCDGSIVFINKNHRLMYELSYRIRVICMEDFEDITNIDEYIDLTNGFKMDTRDTFMYMSTKADDDKNKEFSKEPLSVKVLNKIFK